MRDHKSLQVWQSAHAVARGVIELAKSHWKPYAAALFDQLQRASLSVQLNIAEGYTFGDTPSFRRHLGIAYGSALETRELLELAIDMGLLPHRLVDPLLASARDTQYLLLGMLKRRRSFRP